MTELPWWAFSPSPFSLIFYAACCLYGAVKIYRLYGQHYKRIPRLTALTDSIFMFGFLVVLLDTVWLIACGLRFGAVYPDSLLQLAACLFRNATILALCYLYAGWYLKERAQLSTFYMLLVNVAFLAVWFVMSPSPAWTDWTFALKNNYSLTTVLTSFFVSHIAGKTLVGLTWLTYWL